MLQLEVERQAYYPGEIVRGRVHFTPRKDLSCVGVYVRFKGYEHSAWENGKMMPHLQTKFFGCLI
jgi:hypothetical protein